MSFLERSDSLKYFNLSLLFVLTLTGHLSAQNLVSGQVLDETTGFPLPFVNVVINANGHRGMNTDIQGMFHQDVPEPVTSLTFSFVGYHKVVRSFAPGEKTSGLVIRMVPDEIALNEVVVHAGENPANRIIREVIRNKKINDPEKISSFTYTSYNKVVYDLVPPDSITQDEVLSAINNVLKGGHVMVMESVTSREYVFPDHSEEIVLGTKVSGFKSASFAPLATDIQPFSFYEDYIKVAEINYLNPISQGSLSRYEFHIRDILFEGQDTVFVLSFKPLPGKNFDALKGLLYIHTHQFAIQNVIAEPADRSFIHVSIQQQYKLMDHRQWFPEQLKFELSFSGNQPDQLGVRASGTSYIKDVVLQPELDRRRFSVEAVRLDPLASKRDDAFWSAGRPVPLEQREIKTYTVMDSLGEKAGFDKVLQVMERVGQGKFPVGMVDIDLGRILQYNNYEGARLGLGLYTNDKWIRNVSIGGYAGYGFKDHNWKYGAELIGYLHPSRESILRIGYHNTLQETGKSWLGFFRPRRFDYRSFLAARMDHLEKITGSISFRTMRYARLSFAFSRTKVIPEYNYSFQPDDLTAIVNYINTDATIILRYAYKERLISSLGQRISMGTKFPVFTLAYTRGFKDVLEGDFSYHKVEGRLEYSFPLRNLGTAHIQVNGGFINTPLPYGMLFTGEGSFLRNWSVLVKNSFMTVAPYSFLSDQYVDVHFSHDFGSLLFHIGNWKPTVSVYQNVGWGSLRNPEYHQGIAFSTKEKGLYESGLQLDNLIRFNYFNFSYLGFGAGAFVRYGPYATGRFDDDVVFTFSMTFSTK